MLLLLSFLFRPLFPYWFHALSHEEREKQEEPGDDEMDLKAQFAGSRRGGAGDRLSLAGCR
jgi:hypothetical protein